MTSDELKAKTKAFALSVLELVDLLPRTVKGRVLADQITRSATSVASNYRAVCRARSRAEFIAKLGVVIEEADESAFWLELAVDGKLLPRDKVIPVWKEADSLVAIMTQSRKTAEANNRKSSTNRQPATGNRQ